jgi:hypothetical protein
MLAHDFGARRQVAAALLTLGLFVATIYIDDELSMPEGFLAHRHPRRCTEAGLLSRAPTSPAWESIAGGDIGPALTSRAFTRLDGPRSVEGRWPTRTPRQERRAGPVYTSWSERGRSCTPR